MNVWVVNHYAYAPSHFAGTRHWSLSRRLIELGHKVTVISTSFFHKARRETRLSPEETFRRELVEGVPFIWLRTPPYQGNSVARLRNIFMFAWRVWRECGLNNEPRPDIILGSSPHLLAAWVAGKLARRYEVPFVLEIRDLWPETLVSLGHMSRQHPLVRVFNWIERGLYQSADAIVSLLPAANEYIVAHGGARAKIAYVPNGIDLTLAPPPLPPSDNQRFTLMYAGAHGAANGLDVLLDAARHVARGLLGQKIQIELIGDGPEKKRLQQRAVDERISNVNFRPPVAKREIYDVMKSADAFLMILEDSPVFRWGISPNKLFDYLAAARPVIFSVSTSFNPIQEACAGITLKPGDARTLAKGIEQLARLPFAERAAMGLRGRAYVEKHHDQRILGERLEQVLMGTCQSAMYSVSLRNAA